MKKITLRATLLALSFSGVFMASAQQNEPIPQGGAIMSNESLEQPTSYASLQLNEENQNFYNENGVVRCATVEHNEALRQAYPNRQTKEEFEAWLAPLVEERKARIAQQKANGTYRMSTYNIPVIFHVLAPSQGSAEDLDAQYINAQIDQLNLDFSNQAGSTNPAAADSGIRFVPAQVDPSGNPLAEPGITRHYDASYSSLDSNALDNGVKQATIWDRTQYANIWTANLGGGLLGYAQFPSNSTLPGMPTNGGAATTDGVVCLYTSIGSVANPHPNGGVYAAGRTLTHEIGHWIGLRHIWGDANCGDDFCADTPTQQGSSSGCPNTTTCDGVQDQVENFMDYSYDTCMDLFTNDQVGRMITVIENADAFDQLIVSQTGATGPVVSFVSTNSSTSEGSACSYTDITTGVTLMEAASGNTNVTFSVAGGTATNNVDFQLMTSSVSFASGTTGSRDMVVRVFHDPFVESDETIQIDLAISGSDATIGNGSITLNVTDDDINPAAGDSNAIFTYTSDVTGWTIINNGGTGTWANYTGGLDVPGVIEPNFLGSQASDATMDDYAISPTFTVPSGITDLSIEHALFSINATQSYELYFATDTTDETTVQAGTLLASGTATDYTATPALETIDLSSFIATIQGQTGSLVMRHTASPPADDGYLVWDTITVTATTNFDIQTAVNNGTTNDLFSLPTSGTVYTQDSASGNIMVDITNNNTFDYGCTSTSVFRAGTSAQSYNGSVAPNLVMDKVFDIKPSNIATSEDATVKFYFTDAEIQGWLTANPGKTINDIVAYRDSGSEIVTLTVGSFNSDHTLTGDFTGLNGQYYFGAIEAFQKVSLSPKVVLQGAILNNGGGSLMRDDLRSGGMLPTTSPYADGATCNATVFDTTGNNAIVDWVWVELRDENTNTTIIDSKSALLQRDGDVVGLDGSSAVEFEIESKNYFVVINHRNHLGIMSSTSIALSGSNTVVDFTDANNQITYGTNAQTTFGMPAGLVAMWAGDVNGDGVVQYTGGNADTPSILTNALNDAGNILNFPTYTVTGYGMFDIDMNGGSQYTGGNADSPIILQNALAHPGNILNFATYSINTQLP